MVQTRPTRSRGSARCTSPKTVRNSSKRSGRCGPQATRAASSSGRHPRQRRLHARSDLLLRLGGQSQRGMPRPRAARRAHADGNRQPRAHRDRAQRRARRRGGSRSWSASGSAAFRTSTSASTRARGATSSWSSTPGRAGATTTRRSRASRSSGTSSRTSSTTAPCPTSRERRGRVWTIVPKGVARRYVPASELRKTRGHWVNPLFFAHDRGLGRMLRLAAGQLNHYRKYRRHYHPTRG